MDNELFARLHAASSSHAALLLRACLLSPWAGCSAQRMALAAYGLLDAGQLASG
jgi:hypothetical protein